jgi:hypothetical protein
VKFTDLTDTEIFLRLVEISSKKNVSLRFSDKQFYVSFLHFCEENGEYDEIKKMWFVQLSVSSFMKTFKYSSHTIQRALRLLAECGLIKRIPLKKEFRKISSDQITVNKPYKTYINYKIL